MVRFAPIYVFIALAIFAMEVLIAFYSVGFVRHTFGDFLATMLVYYSLLAVIDLRARWAAVFAFTFSASIELAQALDAITNMSMSDSEIAQLIVGTTFSWIDIIAYALGAGAAFAIDMWVLRRWVLAQRQP